jgi:hypothetical protein
VGDPVSWLVIERGWDVVDRAGEKVGHVQSTLGDEDADIFHGLSISTSLLGAPRYVASEDVADITEGQVRLALTADEVERLPREQRS